MEKKYGNGEIAFRDVNSSVKNYFQKMAKPLYIKIIGIIREQKINDILN